MIISLNWLKKFIDINVPIDELTTLIGARLVEIEETVDLGAKYKDALIVKVVEASVLEGSDHLNITKIDDGQVVSDIERDENGLIQVVCGAPNIAAGQLVVWLPPNSIVPETFGKADPFILGARKLRGVISNGMIASCRELDLSDEHEGILELQLDVKPGTSFAEAFELDDTLLDIANKSLTHRPDCFGIVGFAREVAAIQGMSFKSPDWLDNLLLNNINNDVEQVKLTTVIDNSELSDRYLAVVMSVTGDNKKSPLQAGTYLSRVGVRPISAIVDVTNYLMMLTGQPLHAFDYDKLIALNSDKAEIHVRSGRDKEKLELLDGRTIELTTDDIVIASGDVAIGLAGAMGGASTAIDSNTKNIIIESATFNLYNLRSTQMRHGIFSEAITRFTKGQPAELSAPVLSAAIHLMKEWASAKVISSIAESYPGKVDEPSIEIDVAKINDILGSTFVTKDVVDTLQNVGFKVEILDSGAIKTTAPYWRADIHIVEDIIEEIGRLNGFDNINPVLPKRDFTAVRPTDFDDFRRKLRQVLVRSGANEVLTYNFIHGNILQKAGQKIENSYRITNSISPDLQYYRQTISPSLLGLVHSNIKQGYDNFALFEVNKSHQKSDGMTNENVPVESDMLALVVASKNNRSGSAYYQSKRIFDYLRGAFGVELVYKPFDKESVDPICTPFEYRRSAQILNKKTGVFIGVVGEYKKSVTKEFKLPEYASGFEIKTSELFSSIVGAGATYKPLSRYPASERDICFQVTKDTSYSQIIDAINRALENINLENSISPVDIYQTDNVATKNITVRVRLTSHDHTLNGEEVTNVINSIITSVVQATKALII